VIHKIFLFGGENRNRNQIEIGYCSWKFIVFIFPSWVFGIQLWPHAYKWWINVQKRLSY